MWKKGDSEETGGKPTPPRPIAGSSPGATRRQDAATIGPSITIKGEVTGSEDLVIQGYVEGTVTLKQHHVTIGGEGRVKADITGRTVTVEGKVDGDLHADEQIVLRRSARVQGNMSAPRVSLEDGAVFRGGIDMQEEAPQTAALTSNARKEGEQRAAASGDKQPLPAAQKLAKD